MKTLLHFLIYKPLLNLMIAVVALTPGHNLGLAIIIVTVLVRVLLYRPALSGLRNQVRMQELQPILDKIKKDYKGDQPKQNEEMMRLYKEESINPFGGCLPLLIQLPILIVLYRIFLRDLLTIPATDLYRATPHLTTINTKLFGLDLAHFERFALPISTHDVAVILLGLIAAALQYWQMKMLQPKEQSTTSQVSSQMMLTVPLISIVFALTLPPALPLYWITTTAFTIAQQYWFFKKGHLTPSTRGIILQEETSPSPEPTPSTELLEKKKDVTIKIRKRNTP